MNEMTNLGGGWPHEGQGRGWGSVGKGEGLNK